MFICPVPLDVMIKTDANKMNHPVCNIIHLVCNMQQHNEQHTGARAHTHTTPPPPIIIKSMFYVLLNESLMLCVLPLVS